MKYDYEIDVNGNSSAAIILRNISADSRVFEFGPATGYMTKYMKQELGCSVVCIEIDQEAADKARSFCDQMIVADIERFEWRDRLVGQAFDHIVFADVLEHLRDPLTVLKTALEYLKPDGSILISLPNIGHNAILMELMQGRFQYHPLGLLDESHVRFFTRESVIQLLRDAGLNPVQLLTTELHPEYTEFKQSYDLFPLEFKNLLLDRKDGHVYQFVTVSKRILDVGSFDYEQIAKKNTDNAFLQIYWQYNRHYDEAHSLKLPLEYQTNDCYEVDAILPVQEINELRIDPINHPAKVEILSLGIYGTDAFGPEKLLLECSNDSDNFALGEGVVRLGKNGINLICYSNDPQVFLKDIGIASNSEIRVKVKLKLETSTYQDISKRLANLIHHKDQIIVEEREVIEEKDRILQYKDQMLQQQEQIIHQHYQFFNSKRWRLFSRIFHVISKPIRYARRLKKLSTIVSVRLKSLIRGYRLASKARHTRNSLKIKLSKLPVPVDPVDIIIPIYNAYEMVVECVKSVLQNTSVPFRLILINDCSSDARVAAFLSTLDDPEKIVVLNNSENLGFVGTVNRGLQLSRGHVVLLNSDTEVPPRWLERLIAQIQEDPIVGTVTPFSNNATICSFPDFCQDNQLPEGFDAVSIDQVFAECTPDVVVDIPTAVGFCMLISRPCLDLVGLLDGETFGRGYGEENDFCMRAESLGFRNVLCPNLFVYHKGSASFGVEHNHLAQENYQKLLDKHPSYEQKVVKFISEDPILPIRKVVLSSLALIREKKVGILYVLHNVGGGTESHLEDLIMDNAQIRPYVLKPLVDTVQFIDRTWESPLVYTFPITDSLNPEWLRNLCDAFDISIVHIQHLLGYPEGFKQTIINSKIPYLVTVHDFLPVCPGINLLKQGRFCPDEESEETCAKCVKENGLDAYISLESIEEWRRNWQELLTNAEKVIAPSLSTADIIKHYFPRLEFAVIEHGNTPFTIKHKRATRRLVRKNKPLRICLLGAIGPHKGSGLMEELVNVTRQRNLPFQWIVIGYTDIRPVHYRSNDGILTIHGKYQREEIPELLKRYKADLVFLPAICPETYSYTLSEAWLAGYPVLASDLGALGERIGKKGGGWVLRDLEVDTIIDLLVELSQNPVEIEDKFEQVNAIELPVVNEMVVEYDDLYLEVSSTQAVTGKGGVPQKFVANAVVPKPRSGSLLRRLWRAATV